MTERSFHSFDGKQFFVCARDTGTYLGFLFSFIFYALKKEKFEFNLIPAVILFFFHLVLFGLDGVSSYAKWRETNNFIRYFTGFYVGFFLGIIFQYVEKIFHQNAQILHNKGLYKRYIWEAFFLEIFATILFIVTFVFMKYLLYLLAFAIIFYIYKLVKLVISFLFFNNKTAYYYLAMFITLLLFFGAVFVSGIYKINMIQKFYH
ncbi:MAG: DUF2085 domain-containing protein [bacterium]